VREPVGLVTRSEEQTEALGARLARAVPALDTPAIVYLQGDLGSGKTTFARGALRALGVTGTVRSPSYTLLERYETPQLVAIHLDLYRLRHPDELESLGLRDVHRAGHLWLIEWPERGGERLPAADVSVALEAGVGEHRISIAAGSALGRLWLGPLQGS
jgi:tRNA threonylcarbamoyladenosine biosynthesis protein TsaE